MGSMIGNSISIWPRSRASGGPSAPGIPQDVAATASNARVDLAWTAVSGATSYVVRRATSPGGPYSDVGTPASNSFADTGRTNGVTYYYVVAAVGPGGTSANSAEVSGTPSLAVVRTVDYVSAGRLVLSWTFDPSAAANAYGSGPVNLLTKSDDATTFVRFDHATSILTVSVNGTTEACAVPINWPASSRVQVSVELGGGVATAIRYRISTDGGSTYSLPYNPKGGASGTAHGSIATTGLLTICGNAGTVTAVGGGSAPSWAATLLYTDILGANARVWRPDGIVALNGSDVSSLGDQGSLQQSVTQINAPNQPLRVTGGSSQFTYAAIEYTQANADRLTAGDGGSGFNFLHDGTGGMIAAAVYLTSNVQAVVLTTHAFSGGQQGAGLFHLSGDMTFQIRNSAVGGIINMTRAMSLNTRVRVIAEFFGTTAKLWINGVSSSATASGAAGSGNATQSLHVGNRQTVTTIGWQGQLGDVLVAPTTALLTNQQVTDIDTLLQRTA